MKRLKRVILVAIIIGLIFLGYRYYMNPYRGSIDQFSGYKQYTEMLSPEEAKADLKFLLNKISEKHVSTVEGVPEQLQAVYDEEYNLIDAPISVLELWQKSSRIIKELQDAHSSVFYLGNDDEKLTGTFTMEGDKLYLNHRMLGHVEILSVDGISVDKLFDRFLLQFSYENIYWAEARFPRYIEEQSGLKWLGIDAGENVNFKYKDEEGNIEEVPLHFIKVELSDVNVSPDFVRYTIDKDNSLGVFILDECNYNDQYIETVDAFFKEVVENDIENIAIDLRNNLGGNSYVVNEFMHHLPIPSYKGFGVTMRLNFWLNEYKGEMIENIPFENVFNGNVYVLTSKKTFSSATMFATILQDNGVAESVGEPSGNQPSAYGDVMRFQLPNSGLALVTTFKQFIRPDVEKSNEKYLVPTYWVNSELALEKVYELIK